MAGFDDELLASDSGLRNVQKQPLRALQVPQFGLADLSSVDAPHITTASRPQRRAWLPQPPSES